MTLRVQVNRFYSDGEATNGSFAIIYPREDFAACFCLEDERRTVKVMGETRIPAGIYRLGLNTNEAPEGERETNHQRYSRRFGSWHKGMIELQDVPNFTNAQFHIGNDDDDTDGCILPGEGTSKNWVSRSTDAYRRMYEKMIPHILNEEGCWIHIIDGDLGLQG